MVTPFRAPGPVISDPDDRSGHRHRRLVGFLGLFLPLLLVLLYAWRPVEGMPRWALLDSVSAYYHTGAVAAFVGVLIALAVFLVSYRGYSNDSGKYDRVLALVAGAAATLVALFPTGVPAGVPEPGWYTEWMGALHYGSAAILFVSFIVFSLWLFPKSSTEPRARTTGKRVRNAIYRLCGILMAVCVVWAVIAGKNEQPIFWPEVIAIVAFAVSWLVKGRVDELARNAGRKTRDYFVQPSTIVRDARGAIQSLRAAGRGEAGPPGLEYAADLRATVVRAAAMLRAMPATRAQVRPMPGKWSPREIIGHLVDSASNNHHRFVRAQFRDDLRFDGYAQDDWVRAQDYQNESWPALVMLWESFNMHMARLMESTPAAARTRPCAEHNLNVIAWEEVPPEKPATLDSFMRDYVNHLKHHLRQIDENLAAPPVPQQT